MNVTDRIFDLLDGWRHLPDYQLERRADVFFAAYLPEFLSARLGVDVRPSLIPEFPVRIGTIYPDQPGNQSCKIDYLALTAGGDRAIFLELKTDASSRRDRQDKYLQAARDVGLRALLEGVLKIVRASNHKHKYCRLLRLLERHALLKLPPNIDAALASPRFAAQVNACMPHVRIADVDPHISVLYLQPVSSRSDEIGFDEFAAWLQSQADPIAPRFAASLRAWAVVRPGQPPDLVGTHVFA